MISFLAFSFWLLFCLLFILFLIFYLQILNKKLLEHNSLIVGLKNSLRHTHTLIINLISPVEVEEFEKELKSKTCRDYL